jgi:hypothetical protein
MSQLEQPREIYVSFEEFGRKFYPAWCKNQESAEAHKSFGRDLARYSMDKHFPFSARKETPAKLRT